MSIWCKLEDLVEFTHLKCTVSVKMYTNIFLYKNNTEAYFVIHKISRTTLIM